MNARIKLLFVVTEDWYFVSHRLALAVAAKQIGYDVAVATRAGAAVETIERAGIRLIPFNLSRRSGNPFLEIRALVHLYREECPDIVHHVALKPIVYGAISAWLTRVPAQVNALAGLGWFFTSARGAVRFLRPVVRKVLATLLKVRGSVTIVQNHDDRKVLLCANVPEACIRLIRGAGVDTNRYYPVPLHSGPVMVVFASRMIWNKGAGQFVEAARLLTEAGVKARFVLVGDPDPDNPAAISEHTLRGWHGQNGVEWWGRYTDMPAVFHAAHIMCLPSYYGEGVPLVLLEAAASGLPIVTTDAPGCREIVHDGENGFLVPVRNVHALAQALRCLIDDADLRATMGQRGREIVVKEFSQEQVIRETLAVYRELTQ